jgi:hypothetical protein
VVAEGAGQDLLSGSSGETDPSGNPILGDIGDFLRDSIKKYLKEQHLSTDIQVDGGIYQHNVQAVLEAGANVIVAGTAVFKGVISENIKEFQTVFDNYHVERL